MTPQFHPSNNDHYLYKSVVFPTTTRIDAMAHRHMPTYGCTVSQPLTAVQQPNSSLVPKRHAWVTLAANASEVKAGHGSKQLSGSPL